jgi:hypothetical protein
MPIKDLSGQKFGRLTAVAPDRTATGKVAWICKCDCGREHKVSAANLASAKGTKSCGCLASEAAAERNRSRTSHGLTKTKPYTAWLSMKTRCLSPESQSYARYGARGITVCDEWVNSFEAFLRDVGNPPSVLHSLDRIDNNKGYFPGNCRWATPAEQSANRRSSVMVKTGGGEVCLSDLAKQNGVARPTVYGRVNRLGCPPEIACDNAAFKAWRAQAKRPA